MCMETVWVEAILDTERQSRRRSFTKVAESRGWGLFGSLGVSAPEPNYSTSIYVHVAFVSSHHTIIWEELLSFGNSLA